MPAWSKIKVIPDERGWITRDVQEVGFVSEFGDLGRWPPKRFWQWRSNSSRLSMRLPSIMRNQHVGLNQWQFNWYVPVDRDQHVFLQLYVKKAPSLAARVWAHVYFWAYYRWAHLVQFNNQDTWMVALMPETPPERLYRPDVSITAWRKLCEHARGHQRAHTALDEELSQLASEQIPDEAHVP
jgi:hypothetical protein